jgi:hypothetical protein
MGLRSPTLDVNVIRACKYPYAAVANMDPVFKVFFLSNKSSHTANFAESIKIEDIEKLSRVYATADSAAYVVRRADS